MNATSMRSWCYCLVISMVSQELRDGFSTLNVAFNSFSRGYLVNQIKEVFVVPTRNVSHKSGPENRILNGVFNQEKLYKLTLEILCVIWEFNYLANSSILIIKAWCILRFLKIWEEYFLHFLKHVQRESLVFKSRVVP